MTSKNAPDHSVSASIENYLKAVYSLEQAGLPGETNRIGELLGGIKPASVTAMVKKLAEMDYLEYEPYQGVKLTPSGRRVSLGVIRRHRLLELFLVRQLGYSWDEVHDEAEQLEHYVSDKMMQRMAEKLGHPEFDPHGDPIPALDGTIPVRETVTLADCPLGKHMTVFRVLDQNPEKLKFLSECGLVLGVALSISARDSFSGTVLVNVAGQNISMDRPLTSRILVVAGIQGARQ